MPVSIAVTQHALDLLRAHVAPGRYLAVGLRLPDGRWAIDVDAEVHVRLLAIDPDPSRAIEILCTTGVGHA